MAIDFKLNIPLAEETEFIDYDSITFSDTPYKCNISKLSDYEQENFVNEVYQGYCSTAYGSDGNYSQIIIKIENSYFKKLILYFDSETRKTSDGYNTITYIVNGKNKTIKTNSKTFVIILDDYATSISLLVWTPKNGRIYLNSISLDYINFYQTRDIKQLSLGYESVANNKMPNYGLSTSYGNLRFVDRDNSLFALLNKYQVNSNAQITFKYNNKQLGIVNATSWNYVEKTNEFSAELIINEFNNWKNINVYNYNKNVIYNAMDLFLALLEFTGKEYYKIENVTKNRLLGISLKNCTFDDLSLYDAFNNWCNLTQTCIFINRDNILEVVDYV